MSLNGLKRWVIALGFAFCVFPAHAQSISDLARYAELSASGDTDGAAALARRLSTASARDLGIEQEDLRAMQLELARAMLAAGDLAGALRAVRTVIASIERRAGEASYDLVEPLTLMADIQDARGDVAGAGGSLDRAISISEATLGADHPRLLPLVQRRTTMAELENNACAGASVVGFTNAYVDLVDEAGRTRTAGRRGFSGNPIEVRGCNEQGVFFDFDGARVWAALTDVEIVGLPSVGANCAAGNGPRCVSQQAWFAGDAAARELRVRAETLRGRVRERRAPLEASSGATTRSLTGATPEVALSSAEETPFDIIQVFYGTSRARTGRSDPNNFYSSDRAVERGLETGIVSVSVPKRREMGAIPKPSIWRGEFRPDPAKHVILEDVAPFGELDAFIDELRRTIDRSEKREAFIYIHGFNNDFSSAAERTAQLAADLELDGAPLFYSWPSRGDIISYFADSNEVIAPAVRDLEDFLTVVAQRSGAERLHVVAHSMGNRYLIEALERIEGDLPNRARPLFDELVFAAPDVDADDFSVRMPELRRLAVRMTLYASEKDKALKLSRLLNGGHRRAGDASRPLVIDSLDTVDTSPAPSPRLDLGHEDVFEFALDDFRAVVWFSLDPQRRCILDDRRTEEGVVWSYSLPEPESCDADIFSAAVLTLRRLGRAQTLQLLDNQIDLTRNAGDLESAARWIAVRGIVQTIGG